MCQYYDLFIDFIIEDPEFQRIRQSDGIDRARSEAFRWVSGICKIEGLNDLQMLTFKLRLEERIMSMYKQQ